MVKMSSSHIIFKMSKARTSNKYAIESPQSVSLYDVVRSFLYYFVGLDFAIGSLKTNISS